MHWSVFFNNLLYVVVVVVVYVASLRLGGVPRSSDDHVILVGDAAGMIDPMTGRF